LRLSVLTELKPGFAKTDSALYSLTGVILRGQNGVGPFRAAEQPSISGEERFGWVIIIFREGCFKSSTGQSGIGWPSYLFPFWLILGQVKEDSISSVKSAYFSYCCG
jgi:hypothetical protein